MFHCKFQLTNRSPYSTQWCKSDNSLTVCVPWEDNWTAMPSVQLSPKTPQTVRELSMTSCMSCFRHFGVLSESCKSHWFRASCRSFRFLPRLSWDMLFLLWTCASFLSWHSTKEHFVLIQSYVIFNIYVVLRKKDRFWLDVSLFLSWHGPPVEQWSSRFHMLSTHWMLVSWSSSVAPKMTTPVSSGMITKCNKVWHFVSFFRPALCIVSQLTSDADSYFLEVS